MQHSMSTNTKGQVPLTGREASRMRRAALVQGKAALSAVAERSRSSVSASAAAISADVVRVKPQPMVSVAQPQVSVLHGRAASMARRAALVQGKAALQKLGQPQVSAADAPVAMTPNLSSSVAASGDSLNLSKNNAANSRQLAQAMRAQRARIGRCDATPTRPSARVRENKPIQYAPKVVDTKTYSGQKVTGVRIGSGTSMTGDEPGAMLPVTGTQYIGTESGYAPRPGGVKVGAARTPAGLVVTGSQVRNTVKITGDESNPSLRITGEADQEIADDLIPRDDQGAYSGAQFKRMHNPHGHTVFGYNLGRLAKQVGSRERQRERALELSEAGLPITGTALGRSTRVTGDEPGSCRTLTGDQYLMPAIRQSLCRVPAQRKATRDTANINGQDRPDPVTGEKVIVSETWSRQRITGVAVEHHKHVTGAEHGVCSSVTGTPYVGPGEFEAHCETAATHAVAQRVMPTLSKAQRVTGNIALSVEHVTGTQRGAERGITGTPYYRENGEVTETDTTLERINARFSIRTPQREAQLRMDQKVIAAPSAEDRITGTFAAGTGKITGNQEFHFRPRQQLERDDRKSRITGEGRMEGTKITGGAWDAKHNVTGTEGYIAAERNPSERAGHRQAFAGVSQFKGKGNNEKPTQHVTGMVGWSPKTAAKVTLSGGAQG